MASKICPFQKAHSGLIQTVILRRGDIVLEIGTLEFRNEGPLFISIGTLETIPNPNSNAMIGVVSWSTQRSDHCPGNLRRDGGGGQSPNSNQESAMIGVVSRSIQRSDHCPGNLRRDGGGGQSPNSNQESAMIGVVSRSIQRSDHCPGNLRRDGGGGQSSVMLEGGHCGHLHHRVGFLR
nr:hypothetical protein Itr_chr08CG06200 [Ipomoea trifida]